MEENKKRCSKCREWKDRSEFSKETRRKDGLNIYCRSCKAITQRAYRTAHHDDLTAYNAVWRTEHREYSAVYSAKYRAQRGTEYRDKAATYYAAWIAEHRAKKAVSDAAYRKANPDKLRANRHRYRARKRGNGGTHTAQDVQRQGDIQRWRCWWCGKRCAKKYHVDHLVPLAKGGHNDPSNIVIACQHCNLSKNDKTPDEFCGRLL